MTTMTEIQVSESTKNIIQSIEKLTVLELAELVKALEDKFGVVAAAPVAFGAMPQASSASSEAQEEAPQTVTVILENSGDKKIQVLKVVRELTGLGLKEAKDLVDMAPKTLKQDLSKEEAEKIKKALEDQGAKVTIK